MNLTPYKTNDGIELYINNQTGEVFCSLRGLARMCDKNKSTISDFTGGRFLDSEMTEVPTPGGLQGVRFFSESQMLEVIAKYNPTLLIKFAQLGLRAFLHTMAGYTVKSTAIEPVQPVLPPAHIQVTNLLTALDKIGFEVNNPRFNQGLKDLCGDILGFGSEKSTSEEVWCGVAERAEQIGYPVGLVTRYRSTLGKFVKSHNLTFKEEKRLCNGTQRTINLYLVSDELDNLISEYMSAKMS
jgi:hypothetical protein